MIRAHPTPQLDASSDLDDPQQCPHAMQVSGTRNSFLPGTGTTRCWHQFLGWALLFVLCAFTPMHGLQPIFSSEFDHLLNSEGVPRAITGSQMLLTFLPSLAYNHEHRLAMPSAEADAPAPATSRSQITGANLLRHFLSHPMSKDEASPEYHADRAAHNKMTIDRPADASTEAPADLHAEAARGRVASAGRPSDGTTTPTEPAVPPELAAVAMPARPSAMSYSVLSDIRTVSPTEPASLPKAVATVVTAATGATTAHHAGRWDGFMWRPALPIRRGVRTTAPTEEPTGPPASRPVSSLSPAHEQTITATAHSLPVAASNTAESRSDVAPSTVDPGNAKESLSAVPTITAATALHPHATAATPFTTVPYMQHMQHTCDI